MNARILLRIFTSLALLSSASFVLASNKKSASQEQKTLAEVMSERDYLKKYPHSSKKVIKQLKGRTLYDVGAVIIDEVSNFNIGMTPISLIQVVGACSISTTANVTVSGDFCSGHTIPIGFNCPFFIDVAPTTSGYETVNFTCPRDLYDSSWNHVASDVINDQIQWEVFDPKDEPDCPDCERGSIIGIDGQTLSEVIPIVGTDFELVYSTRHADQYLTHKFPARINFYRANGLTPSIQHRYDSANEVLYLGTGATTETGFSVDVNGNHQVISRDGSEVYVFATNGKHLKTKYGLTGLVKYSFAYEPSDNQLKSITDAFGNVTTFTKNGSGNLNGIQSPRGQTTSISLDPTSLTITSVTNPNSETYSLSFFPNTELLSTFIKPGGQTSTFQYDKFGRLTLDSGNGGNFWSLGSNPNVAIQSLVKSSAMGRATTYSLSISSGNNVRTKTDPYGLVTTTTEAPNGQTTVSNSILISSDIRADDERMGESYQRITSESVQIGSNTSTTTYSRVVSPASPTDIFNFNSITDTITRSGHSKTRVYTEATKTFVETSPLGATTTKILNTKEQPTSFKIGNDTPTTYTYDSFGRISIVDQGGYNTLTYTYNSNGYVQKITNARSEDTLFTYDGAGRVLTTTLPDLRVITYTYDNNGKMLSVTPPSRPVHTFTFNTKELMDSYTPPALTGVTPIATTYNYNNDKQLTSIVRPDGKTLAYNYDATTGLLNSITWSGVGNYYTYFSNSPLVSKIDSRDGVTSQYTYYGDKVATEEQSNTSSGFLYSKVTYNYDSDHRQISRVFRGNAATPATTISTTYNNDSRPSQIGNLVLNYSYPSGRISTTTLDNISDSRTYDSLGNLQSYSATYTPTSTVLYSYTLTRDSMSRISGKTETVQGVTDTYAYTYDLAGRLTAVTKNGLAYSSYVYDNNGNRTSGSHAGTSFTATYNDQDWLLTYNSTVYSYNNNGDLTNIQYTGTNSKALVYDPFGNLKSVTVQPSGTVYNYHLDGKHQRVTRVAAGSVVERYLYENPYQIIGQVGGAGVIQKQYVYATNINSPDYMINSSNVRFRFIKDHLGSPRLVVNSSNGTVLQRMDYTDLGKVVTNTNTAAHPFGFAGGIYDYNTGLTHFGARDYDAETGRWLSKDPIRFRGGDTNLYGYTMNDPVNFVDPTGRFGIAGFAVGYISGFVGGYAATGSVTAALVGGLAGGAVGAVTPTASTAVGVFASNFVSNLAGQALANAVDSNPGITVDPLSPFTSGIGGVVGASAGACMGLSVNGAAAVEGLGSGLGEALGSSMFNNQPIDISPLFAQ